MWVTLGNDVHARRLLLNPRSTAAMLWQEAPMHCEYRNAAAKVQPVCGSVSDSDLLDTLHVGGVKQQVYSSRQVHETLPSQMCSGFR